MQCMYWPCCVCWQVMLSNVSLICYSILSPLTHITYISMQHTYLLCTHTNIVFPYSQFLMPGLVCCHIHADNLENAGVYYEKPYQIWLFEDFIRIYVQFAKNQTYARNVASSTVVCDFGVVDISSIRYIAIGWLTNELAGFIISLHYSQSQVLPCHGIT